MWLCVHLVTEDEYSKHVIMCPPSYQNWVLKTCDYVYTQLPKMSIQNFKILAHL